LTRHFAPEKSFRKVIVLNPAVLSIDSLSEKECSGITISKKAQNGFQQQQQQNGRDRGNESENPKAPWRNRPFWKRSGFHGRTVVATRRCWRLLLPLFHGSRPEPIVSATH
jgi:hypothetical protein